MKTIYENLNTSFVNLSSLVRYLRRENFVGNVRVELDDYEADIILTGKNEPNARENDRRANRVAEGEQALQRVLIRAREPGGIVHVYQKIDEKTAQYNGNEFVVSGETSEIIKQQNHQALIVENSAPIRKTIADLKPTANDSSFKNQKAESAGTSRNDAASETKSNDKSDFLPFELSNNFEAKAKQNQLSGDDWKTLSSLTGELLRTIDETLAGASLNFPAAFQKACAEVAEDYPFFNPNKGAFVYRNGEIEIGETVNAKIFVAGINETLRRILGKLNANPKYAEAERATVQNILALIHHRKPLYEKFHITPQLERSLRVL